MEKKETKKGGAKAAAKKELKKDGGKAAAKKEFKKDGAKPAAKKAYTKDGGNESRREYRKPYRKETKTEQTARELNKVTLEKAGTMLAPVPCVVVSCGRTGEDANMLTIAWAGTVNSTPPMVSVSVRKERHSHDLIVREGSFVINLPSQDLVKKVDTVGVKSGRDIDKWAETEWTQEPAELVSAPLIKEFPINLECKVTQTIELPSHDMFLAEIVRVHVREDLMDGKGQFHPEWAHLVAFNHGKYFGVPRTALMKLGESVMKPKTEKRITNERKAKRRDARRK